MKNYGKGGRNYLPGLVLLCFLMGCNETPRTPVVINNKPQQNATTGIPVSGPAGIPFDQSPLDIIYYPVDFPKLKSQNSSSESLPRIRILYSRPQRHGRVIFGELQKYGTPWRMGANEATEVELFSDATINGKKLAKGRYIMYCIPEAEKWTIAFNTNLYTWGLEFDKSKDVLRVDLPIEILPEPCEVMTMHFSGDSPNQADLWVEWDMVRTSIPFKF